MGDGCEGKIGKNAARWSFWYDWRMRQMMDFIVNSGAYNIIMFTFPIMLSVEEPLDFVKDCMCIFFMTNLDDVDDDETKSITALMIHLKFTAFYAQAIRNQDGDY